MRVILDTNILLSALMVRGNPPQLLYQSWRAGRFELVLCERQLEEINLVSRRPFFRNRLHPAQVGRMVNDLRRLGRMTEPRLPVVRSPDPNDDFLLALADAGDADFLVTGDKSDLLSLARHGSARIVTARWLLEHLPS